MVDQTFKLEVASVEVQSFLTNRLNFNNSYGDNIPSGFFHLDSDHIFTTGYGSEVFFHTKVDSFVKKWGGYIKKITPNLVTKEIRYLCAGFKQWAFETDFTWKFRTDTGNGNMKTIIEAIVAEKFPSWTFDDTSIPDIDIDFVKNYF